MQFDFSGSSYWDRGRPARTEREARKSLHLNELGLASVVFLGSRLFWCRFV